MVQRHCDQYAVMGFDADMGFDGVDADRKLLERAGVDADVLDAGCCGPAGDFRFREATTSERPLRGGHGLRGVRPAPGRAGRRRAAPLHLAEVLVAAPRGQDTGPERPSPPGPRALPPLAAADAGAAAPAEPTAARRFAHNC
ncbi:hypothetical protein [Streptomyces sp. enrichment culture]|uniref:hypothetical protein n=1 Tax=Streptomyces sp. enrichment culture TaxID=1795815 RepID=UPI003F57962D